MASLQNAQIDQSYQGLIKTANNQAGAPFPPAALQYGDGTNLPITLGDGSGIGLGDMVTIQSGTKNININATDLSLSGLTAINAGGATAQIFDGTYQFGNAFTTTNVDFSNSTVTGLPSSGGTTAYSPIGGSGMLGTVPYSNSSTLAYKTNQLLSGYSVTTAGGTNGAAYYQLIALQEGATISEILLSVQTAAAASTAEVAIYDLGVDANGMLYVDSKLSSLGTVDTSTTGDKVITLGTPFTMPAGKVNGQIALVVFRSDNTSAFKGWSQSVYGGEGGDQNGGIYYRAMSPLVNPGVSPGTTLPATIGPIGTAGVTYSAQTSNPLMVLYRN